MKNAPNFRKKAVTGFIRLFLLKKLPLAFLAGVKVKTFDEQGTITTTRFRWINQNPFKSMYFAAMHMAAELATGLLLFQYMDKDTRFSMLLVETKGSFSKKAVGRITFQCQKGREAEEFVKGILSADEGGIIQLPVVARNENGEEVAQFQYTWSCKKKSSK